MGPVTSVAILGHGLIGGSIARALEACGAGLEVLALDRDDPVDRAAGADLIILSAPVAANITNLVALRAVVSSETLITDVGSTKAAIVSAARGMRFIGGHPVAGSAASGPEAADPELFRGRQWILTPTEHTRSDDLARLEWLVTTLGARTILMDPAEHDRAFAYLSHLPQLAISALMHVVGDAVRDNLSAAGPGLRDSTRIAASSPDIWQEIVASNREHIVPALDALIGALQHLRDDRTGETLRDVFENARRHKQALIESAP